MKSVKNGGFALPTVLIAAVILLTILVSAVSITVAVRTSLRDAGYSRLADMAAEAGTIYAKSCLANNNNKVTWSDEKPLKPNTDCQGNTVSSLSAYVVEEDDYRTYFVVSKPESSEIGAEGYVEALRSSGGTAWRVWSSNTASALSSNDNLPVGASVDGYWTSAPPGYLLEDGSAVSRTTYADLFAVIGTTFGAGNGSTTFNLPDSRGRVAVNKSTDTEFDVLGEKQGAKTHVLTIAQLPSHDHGFLDGTHTFTWGVGFPSNTVYAANAIATAGGPPSNNLTTRQNFHNKTNVTGSGQAHNNIQPSIVVLRVIKY